MKIVKRILKTVLVLVLLAVVLFAGTGAYAFHHPRETWAFIEKHFLPHDLKISWESLSFQAPLTDLRRWQPNLQAKNLCITKLDPALDFCLTQLELKGDMSFKEWLKPEIKIVSLLAGSDHLNYFRPNPSKEESKNSEQNIYSIVETWRKRLHRYASPADLGNLDIKIQNFELRSNDKPPLLFKVSLQSEQAYDQAQFEFEFEKNPNLKLKSGGVVRLRQFFDANGNFFHAQGLIQASKLSGKIDNLDMNWASEKELSISAKADFKIKKFDIQNHLSAKLSNADLDGQVKTIVLGLSKPFDHLKPLSAKFNIPQEKGFLWSQKKSSVEISVFLPLFFVDSKIRPRLEKSCKCEIPEELTANLNAEGYLNRLMGSADGHLANMQAQLQSLNNSLFKTRISAALSVDRKNKEYELKPEIDSEVAVASFQGLAILLKEQKMSVPAPLARLDGQITATAKGPIEKSEKNWQFPFGVGINLASNKQRIETSATGSVGLDQALSYLALKVDVLIKNIILELPPLDPVYGVPKIAPDKRIAQKPPQQKKKNQKMRIDVAVHVRSEKENSIQLLYPLAHPSIPLSLKLDYQSGSPVTGEIKLSPFGIEYLRRKSQVEKFKFSLNNPVGVFPIDARMRVDQFPYKIYIDILGNLKTPQVVLSSDPYLDRADIISVLLYGRTSDELVSGDAKTVGSFDAAMADRAIGLIGLWALSSTPIQSFSYNQLSQQYSARLKLSDDTSLSVGTNWEQATSLELQKRLSDRWMIDASVAPTEEDQQTRTLRLQWEDRF